MKELNKKQLLSFIRYLFFYYNSVAGGIKLFSQTNKKSSEVLYHRIPLNHSDYLFYDNKTDRLYVNLIKPERVDIKKFRVFELQDIIKTIIKKINLKI